VSRTSYGEAGYRYDAFSAAPVVSDGMVYAAHPSGTVSARSFSDGSAAWTYEAGDTVVTTPAVEGGLVFLGCFDGRIIALDAGDGSVAWEHDTGAPVTTSPAVHEGSLIIGSRSYDLMSLEAATGSPRWTHYMWFSWVESAPVLAGGRIYIGSSDAQKLSALEAGTGKLVWAFDTGGSPWGRPALAGGAVFIGSAGVSGYIVPHQGGLVAVDRKSGEGLWKYDFPRPEGARVWGFAASPAAGENLVFAGGLDGVIYAFPQH
jgi:outer membrane protein assembly factor BamB